MKRRDFVVSSLGAALWPALGQGASAGAGAAETAAKRPQLFELRLYRLRIGAMETRFHEYAKTVLVPALNRVGIKPVGAFSVLLGPDNPTVHLLLPHSNPESVTSLDGGLLEADAEYRRAAAAYRGLSATDPLYVRIESSLLVAFNTMPEIAVPSGPSAAASRVFELRTYESHGRAANRKKIEMFEKGGEIAIFRRLGLTPVFFARNLIGGRLPSLSYMLVFPDVATRERCWAAFRDDPEWAKLRSTPGFANAEIVSGTHVELLRPTDYSQI